MSDKQKPVAFGQSLTGNSSFQNIENINNSTTSFRDVLSSKPDLLIDKTNPDTIIDALTEILIEAGEFYDYGGLCEVVRDTVSGNLIIQRVDKNRLSVLAHRLARPYTDKTTRQANIRVNCQFPRDVAELFISNVQANRFPTLKGIISSPLVNDDGEILTGDGYDPVTKYYRDSVADVRKHVPSNPTKEDALKALERVRRALGTFPYADAQFINHDDGTYLIDFEISAKRDETSAIAALMTAVLRPNFHVTPGVLIASSEISGAGSGKGKLVRTLCEIAFGKQPAAISYGGSIAEFEKRLGSSLIESRPCCLFDNLNSLTLKSDALASVLTENPAAIRILGTNKLVMTSAPSLICITGNGISLSEDLARRFIEIRFDARVEDPESRQFRSDVVADAARSRRSLLADALTIWRWGRHMDLRAKKRLGGYEKWSDWVIAPLVHLGCADPTSRISETKKNDPLRLRQEAIFQEWYRRHGEAEIEVKDLSQSVKELIGVNKSRQYFATAVRGFVGMRLGGFMLGSTRTEGKFAVTRYFLVKVDYPQTLHVDVANNLRPSSLRAPMPPHGFGSYLHDSAAPQPRVREISKIIGGHEVSSDCKQPGAPQFLEAFETLGEPQPSLSPFQSGAVGQVQFSAATTMTKEEEDEW